MFDDLWRMMESVRRAPVERREVMMMSPGQVNNDPFPELVDGQKFQSGGSYFGVRLAGLHIKDARRFGTKEFPLFLSLAQFKQRGHDRTVPFSIGPSEITAKLRTAGALTGSNASQGWIELQDLPIVPPTPVGIGNLSLFVGLYSVPGDDIVSTLLDVVGDLSKTTSAILPTEATSLALGVANTVYAGFGSLIGLNSMQALVQAQSGKALPGTGSGYLVVANTTPSQLNVNGDLAVSHGKLCRGDRMVTDVDYCLIAIERYSTVLEEATCIAPDLFWDDWNGVVHGLASGEPGAAAAPMRKLLAAIRSTPSLIDADRTAAMAAYLRRYTEEVEQAEATKTYTRGAGEDLATALSASRDDIKRTNPLAARKLTKITSFIQAAQEAPRTRGDERPAALASETYSALKQIGDGADDVLADALLRAI